MTELRARLLSVIETWIPTKSMVIPSSSILAGSVWGILVSSIFAYFCMLVFSSSPIFWCFRHGVSSVSRPLPWPFLATTHIATDGSVVGIGEDPAPGD